MKHLRLLLLGLAAAVTMIAFGAVSTSQDAAAYDADRDGIPNEQDNCPFVATPWTVPAGDDDCDGWTTADEVAITTDPGLNCGGTNAWPPDFDGNRVINMTDLGQVLPPRYGMTSSTLGWDPRYDVVPNGVIDDADVNRVVAVFGRTCTPDSDEDGFSDADEAAIGTNPNLACGVNAWPPDFDDSGVINISDIGQVLPPVFGRTSSTLGWDRRYDIVPNGVIDNADVNKVTDFFGLSCPKQDSDGDGFSDNDEAAIGTNPNLACGVNAWPPNFDDNDNRVINITDLGQVLPPRYGMTSSTLGWNPRYDIVPNGVIDDADVDRVVGLFGVSCIVDSDGDGFSDADEAAIGTYPNLACGVNAWPPDFDNSGVINISDVGQVMPPVFGSQPGDLNYSVRYDIVPNGVIDNVDVDRVVDLFGVTCTP